MGRKVLITDMSFSPVVKPTSSFSKVAKPTSSFSKVGKPYTTDNYVFQDGANYTFQDGVNYVFDIEIGEDWSRTAKPA